MTSRKVKISHGVPLEVTKDNLRTGYYILIEELEDYYGYVWLTRQYHMWSTYQGLLNKNLK